MQHEITTSGELLDEMGNLAHRGWMRSLLLRYDRSRIRAPRFLIKEWDYYCILGGDAGLALTVADNGYLAMGSVSLLDFAARKETTKSVITPFPMGKLGMPPSSRDGDVSFTRNDMRLAFEKHGSERLLSVRVKAFEDGMTLEGELTLEQPGDMESVAIATPFHKPRRFYYNQKVNCMPAKGTLQLGDRTIAFGPKDQGISGMDTGVANQDTAFGVLDWGRGVWTYRNTWYWGSASGLINGLPFGFNIGYGFGDTSSASENVLFYRGKAHKLEQVTFHMPDDDLLKPWRFSSSDGRFEMTFEPVLDRASDTNVLIIRSNQHQVFGYFSGKAVLDGGEVMSINRFPGFAEKVANRW